MEAAERASLRISLSAAGLAVAIASVGSAYLWYQGELKHLQVESSHAIPLTLPANSHLSDVWFSPSDRLFATFETDNKYLNLASWDLEGRTKDPVQTVKFTSGAIQESPELIMNSFHGGIPENSDVAPERALAYAISDDGSIIAWTWKSQLFIGPIGNFNKIKAIPISSPPITAVAIIRSHLAILVNTAASVSIWDAGKGQEIFGSPITKGTTIVWGRGNTRILSSLGVARTYRLDTENPPHLQVLSTIPGGACFATYDSGMALAGTKNGMVIIPKEQGPSPYVVLENRGGIRALAYYNKKWAIAIGDGRLFLVETNGTQITALAPMPEGSRFLAVRGEHFASATTDTLVIGRLDWRFTLSDRAKAWLASMFSLIGLIGFLRVILIDLTKLFAYRRAGQESLLEEASQETPPPSETSPSDEAPS